MATLRDAYLRQGDEPESQPDPFTRDEARVVLAAAQKQFPEWHPFIFCGLRTGMRVGELLGLQWGDVDWRGRFLRVERNVVRGNLTTPKNHQQRRVDMSAQLRAVLRLWRRHQRAVWLKRGEPRPDWIFSSASSTPLDISNVSKAFGLILDKAELHRRGLHQMRHTFASLLINAGEPVTYVSRQLGHRDSSIRLRVYARRLPEAHRERASTDSTTRNQPQPPRNRLAKKRLKKIP
jgi:integrase